MNPPASLQELEQHLHYQLSLLGLPEKQWLPKYSYQQQNIYDVAIIGAGMAGITAAADLMFKGINSIAIFDSAAAKHEGPWNTCARMQTLRSPKNIAGPALGIPALSFQAWYTANYGVIAWQELDRIPRLIWQDYLQWYKQVLGINIQNQHELIDINILYTGEFTWPIAKLKLKNNNSYKHILARHIVLATGMNGTGGNKIPGWTHKLPNTYWQHSSEIIDMHKLKDKRVAIIGGRDSALDAAASAKEHGAYSVTLCVRANDFSQINFSKAATGTNHWMGYGQLDNNSREQLINFLKNNPTPPARGTVKRLQGLNNIEIKLDTNVLAAEITQENSISLLTDRGTIEADFLILATGYLVNLSLCPELASLLPHIKFFQPNSFGPGRPVEENSVPDLNYDFSFKTNSISAKPILQHIHCFNPAAAYSLGSISSNIPAISFGANQLTAGISAKLYAAEFETQLSDIKNYGDKEIQDEDLSYLLNLNNATEKQI